MSLSVDKAEGVLHSNLKAHTAAPIRPKGGEPLAVISGAVEGTKSLLRSALDRAGPQLQSVVHMSSFAAIGGPAIRPTKYNEEQWDTVSEALIAEQGSEAGWVNIYVASKTFAEKAFWSFREDFKPDWHMAAVNPV